MTDDEQPGNATMFQTEDTTVLCDLTSQNPIRRQNLLPVICVMIYMLKRHNYGCSFKIIHIFTRKCFNCLCYYSFYYYYERLFFPGLFLLFVYFIVDLEINRNSRPNIITAQLYHGGHLESKFA